MFAGSWLSSGAKAQPAAPEAGATAGFARRQLNSLIGKVYGTLGSPKASMTIPGNQLPPPDLKFEGVIKEVRKVIQHALIGALD